MAKIGKKFVDLSEFGYDEPVVFKELTMGDSVKITSQIAIENKKYEGNTPEAIINMIVLERLIEKAPFPFDREGLEALPLSMGVFLLEQAQSMLDPLVKKISNSFNMTIEGAEQEPHPTQLS